MRVLLTSHGSTGDIYPIISLGRALIEAGHSVSFASAPLFQKEIEKAGIDYISVPPHWDKATFASFMRKLSTMRSPLSQLRAIYGSSVPYLPELVAKLEDALEDADLLVSSYLFPFYQKLADRKGIPFATVAFCHSFLPTPDSPPENFPRLNFLPKSWQHRYHQTLWKIGSTMIDFNINLVCKKALQISGLPPCRNFLTQPPKLSLVSVSPQLMNRFTHDPCHRFVGYLRWQSPENTTLEAELTSFCQGKAVPVITFGSIAFEKADKLIAQFLLNWPQDKRIIIQQGWAGLSAQGSNPAIKVIPQVSHDQLFRHASCVVHHGGAGTTASALHSGVPQIVIPHIADQHWWGSEVERLGTGVIVKRRNWPQKLPAAILKLEKDATTHAQAQAIAETLKQEIGPQKAVQALEAFYAQSLST